ncbi:PPM-type phosphatase domain-containing protein [Entamoeba marina]
MSVRQLLHHHKYFEKTFAHQVKSIPKLVINKCGTPTHTTVAPSQEPYQLTSKGECFALMSLSLYPILNNTKVGDPICDMVTVRLYENASVVILADGCGWGSKPLQAAKNASTAALKSFDDLNTCETTRDVGKLVCSAVESAHNAIFVNNVPFISLGTTTMLICVFVSTSDGYKGILANVGDCRAFKYNNKKVEDLCGKYAFKFKDLADSRGRLGPSNSEGIPSLGDAVLKSFSLNEDDMILFATDGIHHNLDPQFRKSGEKNKKEDYLAKFLGKVEDNSSSLTDIVDRICQDVVNLTKQARKFMQNNPRMIMPEELPGKLDHATICCLKMDSLHDIWQPVNKIIPLFAQELQTNPYALPEPKKRHSSLVGPCNKICFTSPLSQSTHARVSSLLSHSHLQLHHQKTHSNTDQQFSPTQSCRQTPIIQFSEQKKAQHNLTYVSSRPESVNSDLFLDNEIPIQHCSENRRNSDHIPPPPTKYYSAFVEFFEQPVQ